MGWIVDLLKHLGLSRSAVVAVFLACLVAAYGPRFIPGLAPFPEAWQPYIVATLLISGMLLVVWAVVSVGGAIKALFKPRSRAFNGRLTTDEENFLGALAENPTETLHLANINWAAVPVSRIEFLGIAESLGEKGLVSINEHDPTHCYLTPAGRQWARRVIRRRQPGAA